MAVLSEADLKTAESGVRMVVKHLGLLAVLLGPLRAHFRRDETAQSLRLGNLGHLQDVVFGYNTPMTLLNRRSA